MTQERLTLGRQGEDAAVQYLKSKGMKILERNLRTPVGEIDLIARHRNILVFVEVKTRRGTAFGSPGGSGRATQTETDCPDCQVVFERQSAQEVAAPF